MVTVGGCKIELLPGCNQDVAWYDIRIDGVLYLRVYGQEYPDLPALKVQRTIAGED